MVDTRKCHPRVHYTPDLDMSCDNDIVLNVMIVLTPPNPEYVQFWEDWLVGAALQ